MATLGQRERIGHRAADQYLVADGQQILDHVDLVRDFGAAQDGDERTTRGGNGLAQILDFLLHQEAHNFGLAAHGLGHRHHRSVRPMARSKRIVAVDVGHVGQGPRERGIPFLLTGIEPQILQDQDLARTERGGLGAGIVANHIVGEVHRLAQQLGQLVGGRLHAVLGVRGVFRPSQVTHQDQSAATVDNRANGRQGQADTPIVGDASLVVQWHVEIHSHQNRLAGDGNILDRFLSHTNSLPDEKQMGRSAPCGGSIRKAQLQRVLGCDARTPRWPKRRNHREMGPEDGLDQVPSPVFPAVGCRMACRGPVRLVDLVELESVPIGRTVDR